MAATERQLFTRRAVMTPPAGNGGLLTPAQARAGAPADGMEDDPWAFHVGFHEKGVGWFNSSLARQRTKFTDSRDRRDFISTLSQALAA